MDNKVVLVAVTLCVRTCTNNKRTKQIVKLIKIAGFVRIFKLSSNVFGWGMSLAAHD